jgi:transposase
MEIDNNAAERAIRPIALGRKNYLFAGSDAGGRRAAAIYSLIETAKLDGRDPEAYLRDVLTRIADHAINRIKSCFPGTESPKSNTIKPRSSPDAYAFSALTGIPVPPGRRPEG